MAKPRERNKVMRRLAADALEAEFEALKRRRAALTELGVRLDDMRFAVDEFRAAAATLEKEQSISRSYIAAALRMTSREKAAVWPPKSRVDHREATDDSTAEQAAGEYADPLPSENASDSSGIRSDEPTASYPYVAQTTY